MDWVWSCAAVKRNVTAPPKTSPPAGAGGVLEGDPMRVPSLSTVRFAVLTALVLALFTSGIVVGAAGAPLIIGQANGASGKTTTLTSNKDNGPVLKLKNPGNNRGLDIETEVGVPLKLSGPTNKAPLVVNSGINVTNLSADKVDGWDANSLIRLGYAADDNLIDGDVASSGRLTTTITAPARGWITINGSAYVTNEGSGIDDAHCFLEVNQDYVEGSNRWVDTAPTVGMNEVSCATTVGFRVCSAGSYVVDMEFGNIGIDLNISSAALTAQYSPFSGSGNLPSLLVCLPF
jgi:hypothetical protein